MGGGGHVSRVTGSLQDLAEHPGWRSFCKAQTNTKKGLTPTSRSEQGRGRTPIYPIPRPINTAQQRSDRSYPAAWSIGLRTPIPGRFKTWV